MLNNNNNKCHDLWMSWFIGFSEGDGSFFLHSNSINFEIWQHIKDVQVLYHIKSTLGFGKVIFPKNKSTMAKFVVTKKDQIDWLLVHFSNKSCTTHFDKYNQNVKHQEPSLNNAWLAGFIDAEGCFRIKVELTGSIKLIFELAQKERNILDKIKNLFPSLEGNIRKDREHYVLSFSQIKARLLLIDYLTKYQLKSHKNIVFVKWLKVHRIKVQDRKLTEKEKLKISKIGKTLNKWRDD